MTSYNAGADSAIAPRLGFEQRAFKIRDERAPAFGDYAVAFSFEPLTNIIQAAGVFWVEFATDLQRAPIRRDLPVTGTFRLVGGVRRDPGEDASRDWTRDGRTMLRGECRAQFVYGRHLAPRDSTHQRIDLARRGNHASAFAPALRFRAVDG